jgi:trehalose-6-phosphate synthase
MIRERHSRVKTGLILHIAFPSLEVFSFALAWVMKGCAVCRPRI